MRTITKIELEEYFSTLTPSAPEGYHDEDIATRLEECLVAALTKTQHLDTLFIMFEAVRIRLGEESAILSLFGTGFQMGREFEDRHQTANELSRLLDK